jgi:hypothetical protein
MKKSTLLITFLCLFLFFPLKSFGKNSTSFEISWPLQYGAMTNQFECNTYQKASCLEGIKLFSMQKTVSSPNRGVIVLSKKAEGKGLLVVIKSDQFYTILYNLKSVSVKKGDSVTMGQKIGVMKDNILGFELRDATGKSYDPEKFLPSLPVSPQKKETEHSKSNGRIDPRDKALFKNFSAFMKISGFEKKDIPKMYCIAVWESFLNPKAINHNNNGTYDIGLFQINQVWEKTCGMTKDDLFDVQNNTKCALLVLKKQGITAWSSWKKYARFCNLNDTNVMLTKNDQ